jgi:DNA-binding NarL/FixJ family response regulator
MRFRLVEPRDFPTCRSLLNPALRLSHRVLDRLPTLWRALAVFGTFSVVEDPVKPHPDSIRGFGASVFVSDQFVETFLAAGRNYLDAALYEAVMDGPSPLLSEAQVADANSGAGLNLVVLSYGLRDHDVLDPSTQRVMQLGTTAFYTLHAGFTIKTILSEVFHDAAAQYMKAGGFHLQETARTSAAAGGDGAEPFLFALRREWVQRGVIDPLASLFYPMAPHIGFSRAEQRVLVHALLNRSDAEVADELGLSVDGVKKTWRRIYDRASRLLPYLFADDRKSSEAGRSKEKRRHVLDHLRAHPEELRPTSRPGATRRRNP